jgi:hypothetical protein
MRNAADIAFEDAFTLWNTLQCTLNRLKDADLYGGVTGIEDYEISSMPAAGPLGACGGFVQTARVFWTCGCAC